MANYATMVIGKANPDGAIEVAVAGHNPPLLLKDGKVQSIQATGVPVGLFCEAEYGVNNLKLTKNDALLLYTDGLTESFNSSDGGEEYGEQRVINQLVGSGHLATKSVVEEIIRSQKNWLKESSQTDDVTVLAVKRMV